MKSLVAVMVWQLLLIEWPWVAGAGAGVFVAAVLLGLLLRITRSSENGARNKSFKPADSETELSVESLDHAEAHARTEVEATDTPVKADADDEQAGLQTARDQRIRFEIEELHRARAEQRQRIEAEERLRKANVDVIPDASSLANRPTTVPRDTKIANKIELQLNGQESSSKPSTNKKQDRPNIEREDLFRFLTQLFDDPSTEVRNMAVRALYDLQTDRAASFTRAMREASPERRLRIASALATSGLAEDALSNLSGPNLEKSYDAFAVLFLMAKVGEIQPLIKAIAERPNLDLRLGVVKLLALSGQDELVTEFNRLAADSSLPAEVRSAIMDAMHQLRSA